MSLNLHLPWNKRQLPVRREETSDNSSSLSTLQSDVNRLFDEFFNRSAFDLMPGNWGLSDVFERTHLDAVQPKIDLKETETELKISAELPGMIEDDVEVSLANGIPTLRGEKKEEKCENEKGWYRSERRYGHFQRSLQLPCEIKEDEVKAEYQHGVLTITLPKSQTEQKQYRSIPVKRV